MDLAAVVGLMIEDVGQRPDQRRFLRLPGHVAIAQRAAHQVIIIERAGVGEDVRVLRFARRPERDEVVMESLVEALDVARSALEAGEPDPIADQDVIQGRVNGTEERWPLRPIVGNAQLRAGVIEPTIGPGVVARETMEIGAVHPDGLSC